MISYDQQEGIIDNNKKRKLEYVSGYESNIYKTYSEIKYPKFVKAGQSKAKDPCAKNIVLEDLLGTLDRVGLNNRKAT